MKENLKISDLWLGIIAAALFALMLWGMWTQSLSALDQAIADSIAGTENELMTAGWKAAAYLGNSRMIIVQTLLLTAVAAWFTGMRTALWIPGGVAAAYLINSLIKSSIARPRPEAAWGIEASGYSFPSANAMLGFVLFGMFAIWLNRYGGIGRTARVIVTILAVLLIVLLGWSRLYFRVHYFTDIAAGYAAGGLVLIIVLILRQILARTKPCSDLRFIKR